MNDSKCNIDFTPIQTPNDNHFSRGTWKNIVGGGGGDVAIEKKITIWSSIKQAIARKKRGNRAVGTRLC